VLAACLADESALERPFKGRDNGVLTHALVSLLKPRAASQRGSLRWADVRPTLVEQVDSAGDQHPWFIGRLERRIFGGKYTYGDPGYSVSLDAGGAYRVGAGALMSVTAGAELAVYGSKPPYFPEAGSADDKKYRKGTLVVTRADRSSCEARAKGAPFALPGQGARACLIEAGPAERLRVAVEEPGRTLLDALEKEFTLVPWDAAGADAEVRVKKSAQGGWTISNDVEDAVAEAKPHDLEGLMAGLRAYARYNNVLRMAKQCNDPQLNGCLSVRVLDCSSLAPLANPTPEEVDALIDGLPEAPKVAGQARYGGAYHLATGFAFAAKASNICGGSTLHVSLLNCTAGGKVQYLGTRT
jgi:hypothetical protein